MDAKKKLRGRLGFAIRSTDPEVLMTWVAYLRFAEANPSDRDVQVACRVYENNHLEELRPLIALLPELTEGKPMDLLHEYEIEGFPDPNDQVDDHVKRAFAYANHWRHETPEGLRALTKGVRQRRLLKLQLLGAVIFLVFMGVAFETGSRIATGVSWAGWLLWFAIAAGVGSK